MLPIFEPHFEAKEKELLVDCIDTGWISSQGKYIPEFEEGFAKWNDMPFGVATSNCTTALHIALEVLNIGPGDEVLCPDLTFIAPANMIRLTGATPVLCDVSEGSWAIDPLVMEQKITPKTKSIMVVHPFGHTADMDPILELAQKYNLSVIEDNAEAPGATYKGKLAGSFGDLSCYSFFANKIMTTGEGGLVLSKDAALDKQLRIYRDHGMSREKRYVHVVAGYNYRMTNMQAAIGVAQLSRLDQILAERKQQEEMYKKFFANNPKANWRPQMQWCENVHWMSTITLSHEELRDPLLEHMKVKGIDCRQMVFPVHVAEPYQNNYSPDDFKVSRSISYRSLHLPSSLMLTEGQIAEISETVLEWLEKNDK